MKNIKLVMPRHDLGGYWTEALHHMVKGACMIIAAVVLTLTSVLGGLWQKLVAVVTRWPGKSLGGIVIVVGMLAYGQWAYMHAKVISAEWRADSLSLSLDSLKEYTHTADYEYSRLSR